MPVSFFTSFGFLFFTRIAVNTCLILSLLAVFVAPVGAQVSPPLASNPPIMLAVIEALSGPFANTGEAVMRNLRFAVERVNERGGVRTAQGVRRLELKSYDNKGQVEEALIVFKAAVDDGAQIILQGNSSAVAAALIEAVNKHNERRADAQLLFLNYSAVDPTLTNEKCSVWHFRFDAHADMRMQALTEALREDTRIKRVYLLNQDYSFGQSVARAAREQLSTKRTDLEIVGDELHPMGRVKDFSPYVSKILAAKSDAVITGNWGNDLTLLVKAAKEAGFTGKFYTFYGNALGTPAAIGEAGVNKVLAVAEWHYNAADPLMSRLYEDFRKRYPAPRDDYLNARMITMIDMLVTALEKAPKPQAASIANELAGLSYQSAYGLVTMRAQDHQLLSALYVSKMSRQGAGVKYDVEGSGYGFVTERKLSAQAVTLPTTCKMLRP